MIGDAGGNDTGVDLANRLRPGGVAVHDGNSRCQGHYAGQADSEFRRGTIHTHHQPPLVVATDGLQNDSPGRFVIISFAKPTHVGIADKFLEL